MVTCPTCGRSTAQGAFCERCGAELPAPERQSTPEPTAPSEGGPQHSSDRFAAAPPMHNLPHDAAFSRGGDVSAPQFRAGLDAVSDDTPTLRSERHAFRTMERAFASIDDRLREVDERIDHETSDEAFLGRQRGEPTLAQDRKCALFENMNGILRFRFDPLGGGERVENVTITFSNCDSAKTPVQRIRHADRPQEFPVQFPPQAAGLQSWEVRLEYHSSRRKHELVGQFQVFVRPVESRKRGSDNFNINIQTNVGNVGHASDVKINQGGVDGLAGLIAATDPFEEMQRIAMSRDRDWQPIPLSDDSEVVSLPPQPVGARTERVILDFGNGRHLHLFAGRTVSFGRSREFNDFFLRPPQGADETELVPYRKTSRRHCFFEHSGESVKITDGGLEPNGVVQPSSGGTYWNDDPIRGSLEIPVGTSGVVSFGSPACAGGLSMELKVCRASKACETCPHSNIHWCGEGKRPSLMLTRRDRLPEKFIAVWSCFWLGDADPSLEGVVIFRKDGAFAFRNTYRSGWLVPGTDIQTDYGTVKVLHLSFITHNS